MDGITSVEIIKRKFKEFGHSARIHMKKGRTFTATVTLDGIEVDNLGNQSLLPWEVFEEAVNLLVRNGGRAERGDAMNSKLGDVGLPLDSIEGHVAHEVYGKQIGESIFRRISPIAAILEWAGLCDSAPRELILRDAAFFRALGPAVLAGLDHCQNPGDPLLCRSTLGTTRL